MKLFNGDCLELLKEIPDNSIDMVLTDPPYDIEITGGGMFAKPDKQYVKELTSIKDGFSDAVLDELCRVMKHINIYIFCSKEQIFHLLEYFVKERKCNWNIISWHKSNPVPACGNKYLTDTEYVLFFREKGVKVYGSFETKRTWFTTPLNQKDKELYKHPTIKPLGILENFIKNSSQKNEVILDCFMGSGSTGAACIELDRDFIGMEINKDFFEIAKKRIETAKLNKIGWLFDD